MRDIILYLIAFVFLAFPGLYAKTFTVSDVKLKLDFSEQIRMEYWDTFDNGAPGLDSDYAFYSSKMRLGAGLSWKYFDAYVQLHYTQFFNLPDDAMFGTGLLYHKFNNLEAYLSGNRKDAGDSPGYAAISQAWIAAKIPWIKGLKVKVGRFAYNSALETGAKNPTIKILKKVRISQRLIGTFEWSRVGRSFDGFQVAYDRPYWNFTLTGVYPTAGGFYLKRDENDVNGYKMRDISILAAAFSLKDSFIDGLDAQVFYYYYNDDRGMFDDGKGADPEIHTLGGHLIFTRPLGPGAFDFLIWGAYQWGDWGDTAQDRILDHRAYAVAVEGGYKFTSLPFKPWLRIGYFYGSGDDDPDDGDHETFFMMIPTLRIYARTPFYNLMNTEYVFGQLIFKPLKNVVVRSDLTRLWLTEEDDKWYLGSGVCRPDVFGYSAKPSGDNDDFATMWDVSVNIKNIFNYKDLKVNLVLYYSHVWGDDVVEYNFKDDDDMDFFYTELQIKF